MVHSRQFRDGVWINFLTIKRIFNINLSRNEAVDFYPDDKPRILELYEP